MAKVQIKSEKITAFGGIFFVLDKFDRRSRWDRYLGMTAAMTQVPVPTATPFPRLAGELKPSKAVKITKKRAKYTNFQKNIVPLHSKVTTKQIR